MKSFQVRPIFLEEILGLPSRGQLFLSSRQNSFNPGQESNGLKTYVRKTKLGVRDCQRQHLTALTPVKRHMCSARLGVKTTAGSRGQSNQQQKYSKSKLVSAKSSFF